VDEVLRIAPPVPLDPKFCVKDAVLPSGVRIAAGTGKKQRKKTEGERSDKKKKKNQN
jgi:hypothetical protein